MSSRLTLDQVVMSAPKKVKSVVTQDLVDRINKATNDPEYRSYLRENFIGFMQVMQDGKFKIEQYVSAVKFVSYKLMGNTDKLAYSKTFPQRYARLLIKGGDVSPWVSAYKKNKLVNLILEQSLIPSYIFNAELYQRALNTQADLMQNSKSDFVRTQAANSILMQLKQPEVKKLEVEIGVKGDNTIAELRASTQDLVDQQKAALIDGSFNIQQIASTKLKIEQDKEVVDADFEEL